MYIKNLVFSLPLKTSLTSSSLLLNCSIYVGLITIDLGKKQCSFVSPSCKVVLMLKPY